MIPIFIPTRGRTTKQLTLHSIPKIYWPSIVLVTSESEVPDLMRLYHPRVKIITDKTTNLSDRRQFIQEFARGARITRLVMMDDDLVFLKKGPKKDPEAKTPYSMYRLDDKGFINMMIELALALDDNAIASLAERNRCHTYSPDEFDCDYNGRINGVIAYRSDVVEREKLKWNNFKLCADFDMTLSLYRAGYSGAVICRYIWGQRGASNAAGGCSNYRTKELHADVIYKLARKHDPFVKVVEKETKGGWYGEGKRIDARISWKKAWKSAPKRKTP